MALTDGGLAAKNFYGNRNVAVIHKADYSSTRSEEYD